MTKDQIEVHGPTIRWFSANLENAELGVYYFNTDDDGNRFWDLTHDPKFSICYTYIPNDKWVEYRKAQAEGKKLQVLCHNSMGETEHLKSPDYWEDVTVKDFNQYHKDTKFQIKPDSHFKAGDWVIEHSSNKLICLMIQDVLEIRDYKHQDKFTKWSPVPGEWYIFWNDKAEHFAIGQYDYTEDGLYYCKGLGTDYKNIAPREYALDIGE